MIRTQRALGTWNGNSDPTQPGTSLPATVRIERHAYDGQRRIATVRVDEQPTNSHGQAQVSTDRRNPTAPTQIVATAFEYVWGPGDGQGGVDELVAVLINNIQFTPVLDHMGSVVGWTRTLLPSGDTETLEHRVFDPYGQIIRRSGPLGPDIPVGHQGLFHERLDYADNPGTAPRVFEPWSRHIVLNRSRIYLPSHGRFAQQDPNATGATPVTSVGFHGATPWASVDRIDVRATFGDGLSIYEYVRSCPSRLSDATGLASPLGFHAAAIGLIAKRELKEMLKDYVLDQAIDAMLAVDWSSDDDSVGKRMSDKDKREKRGKGEALHRLLAGFLGGEYTDVNTVSMDPKDHTRFHKKVGPKFSARGLFSPNASGDRNWRKRLKDGKVAETEMASAIEALREACREFDDEQRRNGGRQYNLSNRLDRSLVNMRDADRKPKTPRRRR